MIIDSHAYCFEPADAAAGFDSAAEHLAWVQASHAGHHQPAWRLRDRAPASSAPLAGPDGVVDFDRLPDVDFRVDHDRGRVVWTVDGEDYTKQFYPPNLQHLEFTPHSLVAEMDYAGVDVALLHVDAMLGRGSQFQAECVRAYPDRIRSMAPVDEWRVAAHTDACIVELRHAIDDLGLDAIKFNTPHPYYFDTTPWDSAPFIPFWDAATDSGVPIFFTLGSGPLDPCLNAEVEALRRGYLGELQVLSRWMERYPEAICSITHGLPWRLFLEGDRLVLPEAVWEPFANPNLSLEVCFPVRLGDLFRFPYREVWPALELMLERIGSDRLLWGTDMPFQNRFCTYRQSRDWIEGGLCDFVSPEDVEHIMGGTAARILGMPRGRRKR